MLELNFDKSVFFSIFFASISDVDTSTGIPVEWLLLKILIACYRFVFPFIVFIFSDGYTVLLTSASILLITVFASFGDVTNI